jgi:hypothetical protein
MLLLLDWNGLVVDPHRAGVSAIQMAKYAVHRNPVEAVGSCGYSDIIPKPLRRNLKNEHRQKTPECSEESHLGE